MDTTSQSLLIRVRNASDFDAWAQFDRIYRPMLTRFSVASGLTDADAEDVVQHCMTAISQHIKSFEYDPARGRFKGWLRTLVSNRIRNLRRGTREFAADSHEFERPQSTESSPDDLFDVIWQQELLSHCLAEVRKDVAESSYAAFEALVLQEQPLEQVCRRFEMNAGQVHVIRFRMTQRIRNRMHLLLGEDKQ